MITSSDLAVIQLERAAAQHARGTPMFGHSRPYYIYFFYKAGMKMQLLRASGKYLF